MYPLAILIGGPTASGKTDLALSLQSKIPSYIVNSDSMQVYDKLKLLTNVPSRTELNKHSCKLFSFINYPKKCDLGVWLEKVKRNLSISNINEIPIFVGGTGLYLDSLNGQISPIPKVSKKTLNKIENIKKIEGNNFLYHKLKELDIEYAAKISVNDSQRIIRSLSVIIETGKPFSFWHSLKSRKLFRRLIYIFINHDRNELYQRINNRCEKIIKYGGLDEVYDFSKIEKEISHPLHKSIGFQIFKKKNNGILDYDEALDMFRIETRRYAKRQITWFKNRSKDVKFIPYNKVESFILKNL